MAMKFYSRALKNRARILRAKGDSYKEISKRLGVAKSTARLWAKSVILSPAAKERLYNEGVRKMTTGEFSVRNRRLRAIDAIIRSAKREIDEPISASAFKLLGAMLYWAEGAKDDQVAIINSDPILIKFMVEWMKQVFGASCTDMHVNLNIYSQQDDQKLKIFWSELTGISLENFGKSFVKPANKGYKKNTLYYGTAKVRLKRSGDNLHRLFGWVRKFLEDISIDVDPILTRWNSLKTDYGREQVGLSKNPKKE